jgi:glycosyltransferase involved in cell wall biosynthesis
MKLLFVTCQLPYPPNTGSTLLTSHHIEYLGARHRVDLISFKPRKHLTGLGEFSRWCNTIELIVRPPRWRVALDMIKGLALDPIPEISCWKSGVMARAVDRRLATENYDAVLFQLASAQFRPSWYQGPTIWSFEAPIAMKMQRELPVQPWHTRLWNREIIRRLNRYERDQAPHFDCITCLNEEEYPNYRSALSGPRVRGVPYGVDVNFFCPSGDIPRREGMIVLTGNMFHRPTVDAVNYFCREIFPLVCKQEPSAILWIVGARPVRSVRKWNNSRIRVTGFVPDVRLYLRQAMVSVCPLRARVGTLTKVLEALACGTPVVSTRAGNCGIGGISGKHLHVADEPAQFADKVVSLLRQERWSELSKNGREFVVEGFTWEKSGAKLEQILRDVLAGRRNDTHLEATCHNLEGSI